MKPPVEPPIPPEIARFLLDVGEPEEEDRALARNTDPDTSHAAADSLEGQVAHLEQLVLDVLPQITGRVEGPDREIVEVRGGTAEETANRLWHPSRHHFSSVCPTVPEGPDFQARETPELDWPKGVGVRREEAVSAVWE